MASLGPKNVEMTAEVADGWMPLFYLPEKAKDVWGADLAAGAAKRDAYLGPLEVAPAACSPIGEGAPRRCSSSPGPMHALYVGGMGAKGRNFYNDLVSRYGYEEEAEQIQDLYLDGKKDEAAKLVPEELLEKTTLCGPEGYIKERLAAFKEAGTTVLNVTPIGADVPKMIEQVKSWIRAPQVPQTKAFWTTPRASSAFAMEADGRARPRDDVRDGPGALARRA